MCLRGFVPTLSQEIIDKFSPAEEEEPITQDDVAAPAAAQAAVAQP